MALAFQAAGKLDAVHAVVIYNQDVTLFFRHLDASLAMHGILPSRRTAAKRTFYSAVFGRNLSCQVWQRH